METHEHFHVKKQSTTKYSTKLSSYFSKNIFALLMMKGKYSISPIAALILNNLVEPSFCGPYYNGD